MIVALPLLAWIKGPNKELRWNNVVASPCHLVWPVNEIFELDLVQTKRSTKILNVLCVGWDLGIEGHEL